MSIEKSVLRSVITDQQKHSLPDFVIEREQQKIAKQYLQDDRIIIISGLRRCGKSTLLQALKKTQTEQNYYLNFDDERLATFKVEDFQMLYELFIEMFGEQRYFYFDEIQNIPEWERFARRLHDEGKKLLITGSNAAMLSQELGTRLTGRYRQIELLPFSFREYLNYNEVNIDAVDSTNNKGLLKRYFNQYINQGGIPAYLRLLDPQYLQDLYEGILYRDIIARYHLTKISEIKELAYHAASNVAKLITYNQIKKLLSLQHPSTVKEYFNFFQQSYLFFLVSKFDSSTKRQILAPKKLYCIDTHLAKMVGFRSSPDSGRLLENIVYLELRRQGKDIYYFNDNKECDFIIKSLDHDLVAIQVTVSLQNPEVYQREIAGLLDAMQQCHLTQGWILTEDEERTLTIQHEYQKYRIHVIPVWKWLFTGSKIS